MRSILNLSLPPKTASRIKERARKRGFATTSAYVRFLLESDDDLISPDELLAMAKRADREYRSGKTKKLASLKDLL
jgi:hypothetical protein